MLQALRARGVEPNVVACNAAISLAARGGQWQLAFAPFWGVLVSHIEPSTVTDNAAVSACEEGRCLDSARAVLRGTRGRGLELDVVTSSAAISVAEKAAQWEPALELLGKRSARASSPM